MKFSVLVPVYNVEEYLEECVESVLSQDVDDYEIILIDDGSTDRSGQICDEYKEKYPLKITVVHKENEGLLMARRDALKLAKGEYILFLDSDDYYEPGALKVIGDVIDSDEPDMVMFNLRYVKDGKYVKELPYMKEFCAKHIFEDKAIIYDNLYERTLSYTSLVLKCCRRECIGVDTDYRSYKGLNYAEDLLQSIEIFTRCNKIVYISNNLYCYRVASGMTSSINLKVYTDNKQVDQAFRKYSGQWEIDMKEEKNARHFLKFVSDITRSVDRMGKLSREAKDCLAVIAKDVDYKNSFETVYRSSIYKQLDIKERAVLYLLYKEQLQILYMITSLYLAIRKKKWE